MVYIRGSDNVIAVSLSRAVNFVQVDSIDHSVIVKYLEIRLRDKELHGTSIVFFFPLPSGTSWCNNSTFFLVHFYDNQFGTLFLINFVLFRIQERPQASSLFEHSKYGHPCRKTSNSGVKNE